MIVAGNKTLFMDGDQGIKVMQALGNETRLLMLSLLSHRPLNLSTLAEAISLPMYQGLSQADQDRVTTALSAALNT